MIGNHKLELLAQRFDSIRIHEQSGMYQQSFLSTITLDGSGSGYLVTGIYRMLQRRYHRNQITTTRNMSRIHQPGGLSILARYTSVAAIAIASSALSLKSAANEQARDDQVKTETSEDGQTAAAADRPVLD